MTSLPSLRARTLSPRGFASVGACLLAAALQAQTAPAPTASAAKAADDQPIVLQAYTVRGVRSSLITAEEIKENAVPFVDSIVAEDIGKLPDNTVADALQRVPGIQVARDGGEVNSVIVRGLPNIGTTLNGEEIFTGTGRGVALQDIPAELVAGVDVYKTNTPEQVEGGIAGLIDIRLRKPLDFAGLEFAAGGRWSHSKYARKDSWVASGLLCDRWKLPGGGDFGALFSSSANHYHVLDQRVFNFLWEPVPTTFVPGQTAIQLPVTAGSLITPADRRRTGNDLSLQFKPNENLELYTDLFATTYRNKHDVHFFIGFPRFGAFQSVNLLPGTNIVKSEVTTNNFHLNSTQAFDDRTDSYQADFGLKWTQDSLKLDSEVVYNWSSAKNRVVIVDTQYVAPSTFTFDLNNDNGVNVSIAGGSIQDANNFRLWGLFDNHGYATSHQFAWKGSAAYDVRQGLITEVKIGLRVADREVRNRQTAVNNIPPVGGAGVPMDASIPGFGSLAPDGIFSKSDFGASNWYAGDPNFLRDHVATIRGLFGLPASDPNFDPTQAFTDQEKTYAGFLQANYKIDTAGGPIEGLLGFRLVRTDQTLVGSLVDGTPINGSKGQWDLLPVLNARMRLQPKLLARLSLGRSITRPNFSDLNPVVSLFAPTTTGGTSGTGNGGNPGLKSVKSNNADFGLEYYFAKAGYVSITPFYRQIDGYVQTFASTESIAGTNYIVTRPRNSGQGHLDGVELSYQHFPDFLPNPLKGFGWETNFTYIEGQNRAADPTSTATVAPMVDQPYAQVSKESYNLIGIYERGGFSTRLAYNWRGTYVDTFNGPNSPTSGIRTIHVRPTKRADFNASYSFTNNFTITFDATNIFKEKYHDYFGDNASLYPRDTRLFDQTYEVGARYRY